MVYSKAIKPFEIINVVRNALKLIDSRLIEHGERVAFMAYEMLHGTPYEKQLDMTALFLLCVFHDVGAYKTEEIDSMVLFETKDVLAHSVYGYLFLKHMSPLRELGEAVLYHHTDYSRFSDIKTDYAQYAQIIYLIDRIDVLNQSLPANRVEEEIRRFSGTKFNPQYVELFFEEEAKKNIISRVRSNDFHEETNRCVSRLHIDNDSVFEYLKTLVYAIDFRSSYTVSHTINATSVAVEIGKLFGLNKSEMDTLYYGAFLHDIGKIAVPVGILEKTGKLDDEEMTLMRTHVQRTEDILRGVVSDEICDVSVRHHEKLDGTGYPHGLYADKLTHIQRILAVADILSALNGERSYKKGFSKEKTLGIIRNDMEAGKLCPTVCNMVFGHYDTIMSEADRACEPVTELYRVIKSEYNSLISEKEMFR